MLNKYEDKLLFLFIALFVFISFILFMYFSTFKYISVDTAVWGAFGDYIGGLLNPVFAFLSFTALLVTLLFQNKQLEQNQQILQETIKAIKQNEEALKQNQSQLEFNRIEMENSNKQLELSAKAQTEIEKTQKVQQFDMLFTTILTELNSMNRLFQEKNLFSDFYKVFIQNYKIEFKQVELRKKYNLTKYFILLYQLFKLVVENRFLSYYDQKKYINIVRAIIDNSILQLLMLNCNCEGFSDDFDEFYDFIEEFGVLEHMDFQNELGSESDINADLLLCLQNYKDKSFGNSIYLTEIKEIWYFSYIKKHNIKSKLQLFLYLIFSKRVFVEGNNNNIKASIDFTKGNSYIVLLQINNPQINIDIDIRKCKLIFQADRIQAVFEDTAMSVCIGVNNDLISVKVIFSAPYGERHILNLIPVNRIKMKEDLDSD